MLHICIGWAAKRKIQIKLIIKDLEKQPTMVMLQYGDGKGCRGIPAAAVAGHLRDRRGKHQ